MMWHSFVSVQFTIWKMTNLANDLSGVESFFEPKIPWGSSSLKQALLVHFKIWEFARNLHFPMIFTCSAILALKDSTALSTSSWYIISLAWGCVWPSYSWFTAFISCQISVFQRYATVARTFKIPEIVANTASCPHCKNELIYFLNAKM
jgi:hypothetical protein